MPETKLKSKACKLMIVSRGHGRGHAVPDMAIARELALSVPNLEIQFVSYAAGAEAYRACGFDVLDLRAADKPPMWDQVIAFTRLLCETKPDLVVAHEEPAAVVAARAFRIPSLFITDYFIDPKHWSMQALRHADEIIFTAQSGLYTEPPYLKGRVRYVGRAVRQFEYTLQHRERARHELDIPPDATVVLCQPGAWVESQVPLADLMDAAWDLLPCFPKLLIWLAGRDFQTLSARFAHRSDIHLLKEDWRIDRLMAASDILITKANRMTVYEAASLGLPSISISSMVNWPDDVAVANVESNTPLSTDAITPSLLAALIEDKAESKPLAAASLSGGIVGAAERIAHYVERLGCAVTRSG